MKLRDVKELHTKTNEELAKQLQDIRAELAKMKIDASLGKVKNSAFFKESHRDVARILTILKSRMILGQNTPKVEKNAEEKKISSEKTGVKKEAKKKTIKKKEESK